MTEITSAQNARVKALRSLRLRKYREESGHFCIEGIRVVEEALERGAPVEALVYSPGLLSSERARTLVAGAPAQIERLALSPRVFTSLSDREGPQGIAAVVRIREVGLESIVPRDDLLVVVAHQLHDPGNLGSVIRTADAAGAAGVVVIEPSADVYDPQCVRATMGSLFALPVVRLASEGPLRAWCAQLRAAGLKLQIVATSARGESALYDTDLRGPLVMLLGSERDGLPAETRTWADVVARLPMRGSATSLNVSAAAAALLFEVVRQRRPSAAAGTC